MNLLLTKFTPKAGQIYPRLRTTALVCLHYAFAMATMLTSFLCLLRFTLPIIPTTGILCQCSATSAARRCLVCRRIIVFSKKFFMMKSFYDEKTFYTWKFLRFTTAANSNSSSSSVVLNLFRAVAQFLAVANLYVYRGPF